MSHLNPIFAVWNDNAEAMANDIGEQGVTVRQWRNRNNIPSRAWKPIIEAAALKGSLIDWRQFIPPAQSQSESEGAVA